MAIQNANFEVEEKLLPAKLVGGIRMRGKYAECGKAFGQLGRAFGRHICGPPLMLLYDEEFREEDADFEVCMPIRKGASKGDIVVHELPAASCLSLLHQGPYDELGRSYEKIFAKAKELGLKVIVPSREVYLKGPGWIFRGNPKNYLTEIQLVVDAS